MIEHLATKLLVLSKCGTNKVQVHTFENKVWFSLLGVSEPDNSPFFTLDLKEWNELNDFVTQNLSYVDTAYELILETPLLT